MDLRRISVERFFHSDPSAKWLFPEVVREAVVSGLRQKPRYPELIARDERISGSVYDVPYVNEDPAEEELRQVAEGAAIPESTIRYGDRVVRLDKKGRGVIASYEVIRRMSVDMLRVHLRRMGERLGRNLDARLAHVLAYGDGSGMTAPETVSAETTGNGATATWSAGTCACRWSTTSRRPTSWPGRRHPRRSSRGSPVQRAALRLREDGQTAHAARDELGAHARPARGPHHHPGRGLCGPETTEQELLLENDKLIHQQWDRAYLTVVTDFAILYERARVVLERA